MKFWNNSSREQEKKLSKYRQRRLGRSTEQLTGLGAALYPGLCCVAQMQEKKPMAGLTLDKGSLRWIFWKIKG